MIPPCKADDAAELQAVLERTCHRHGYERCRAAPISVDGAPCYARCQCATVGMPVRSFNGLFFHVEEVGVGDQLAACGLDFEWTACPVAYVGSTPGLSRQTQAVLVLYLNTAIVVPLDHIFVLSNGKLITAERLCPGLELKTADGDRTIIENVHIGPYFGSYVRIAMALDKPDLRLNGRLLNTNGLVSADYSAQIFCRSSEFAYLFSEQHTGLPSVGSAEYVDLHGEDCLGPPPPGVPASVFFSEQ